MEDKQKANRQKLNLRNGSIRTPPNCARCRNHGLRIILNRHKRYCKFRSCDCERCLLTTDRQRVMAKQTAQKRAREQDEARTLQLSNVIPETSSSPSAIISSVSLFEDEESHIGVEALSNDESSSSLYVTSPDPASVIRDPVFDLKKFQSFSFSHPGKLILFYKIYILFYVCSKLLKL